MELVLNLIETLAPAIIGLLTVPVMSMLKKAVTAIDGLAAPIQQMIAVGIAWGLTQLGALTSVVLPESLTLITGDHVDALLAAAIAFAVHAGRKAKGLPETT